MSDTKKTNRKQCKAVASAAVIILIIAAVISGCNGEFAPIVDDIEKSLQFNPAEQKKAPFVAERFKKMKVEGEITVGIKQGLEVVDGKIYNRVKQAIEARGYDLNEIEVWDVKLKVETGESWDNILIGLLGEEDFHYDKTWIYGDLTEAGNQYEVPGKGTGGGLIPTGYTYLVNGEEVGPALSNDQVAERIRYYLATGDKEDIKWARGAVDFIEVDYNNRRIQFIDPWTRVRYKINERMSAKILAHILPEDSEMFPGLVDAKTREFLDQGMMPEKRKGRWIIKNEEDELLWEWNEMTKAWKDIKKINTSEKELENNIVRWLNYETEVSEGNLAINNQTNETLPIGFYGKESTHTVQGAVLHDLRVQTIYLGAHLEEVEDFPVGVEKGEVVRGKQEIVTVFVGLTHPRTSERLVAKFSAGPVESPTFLQNVRGQRVVDYRVSTSRVPRFGNDWMPELVTPVGLIKKLDDNIDTPVIISVIDTEWQSEQALDSMCNKAYKICNQATKKYMKEVYTGADSIFNFYRTGGQNLPNNFVKSYEEVLGISEFPRIYTFLANTDKSFGQ